VGVRNYDKNELRNLPYSEPDVTELADLLRNAGYQRVTLLTQTRGAEDARFLPTAENIRKSLKGLLRDKDKDDNVMVAFAGHGVQFRGSDEHYFCPMDAKLGDKKTLVGLNEVYEQMKGSEAGFKLLLADACRNDPQSDSSRSLSPVKLETVLRPQRRKPPGGVEAFFSCSEGQKAYESADLKHGIFFHFVLEGLKGGADYDRDGDVDLDELLKYTKKKVRDKVQDEFGEDVEQVPQGVGDIEGVVPLIHYERLRTTRD
jgi:uncharacterized caspase-like protein